jgi:ADP-heptose:LPS heptosyltransferase
MEKFVSSLQKSRDRIVVIGAGCTGLGDKLNLTPVIRELKLRNKGKELILIADEFSSCVYKNSPYIDYLLPAKSINFNFYKTDIVYNLHWSFYEHHQNGHVIKSYFKHVFDKTEGFDYRMEMFCNDKEIEEVNKIIDNLPTDKPLIAISPAYTMFCRMLPFNYWQEFVNKNKNKYNFISFGGSCDANLTGVYDYRNRVTPNQIPYILNKCYKSIVINSGFLHISGCSNVPIVYLETGQFPAELHWPYRNNKFGYDCEVIKHDCEVKNECFQGHITESELGKQYKENLDKYSNKYEKELILKYTCWHYCYKKENKYNCQKLIVKKLLELEL